MLCASIVDLSVLVFNQSKIKLKSKSYEKNVLKVLKNQNYKENPENSGRM